MATAFGRTSKQTATIMNNERQTTRQAKSSRAEAPLAMEERRETIVELLEKGDPDQRRRALRQT